MGTGDVQPRNKWKINEALEKKKNCPRSEMLLNCYEIHLVLWVVKIEWSVSWCDIPPKGSRDFSKTCPCDVTAGISW